MQRNNLANISQFWQQNARTDYQKWRPASTWQEDWQGETFEEIEQELNHRKIKKSNK